MTMTTREQFVEAVKAALKQRADLNHDGRVSRADVEVAVNTVHAQLEAETLRHPTGMLIVVAVGCSMIGWFLRALAC